MKKIIKISLLCVILWPLVGCEKEFLDIKPRKSLLVPSSLSDIQALFDNVLVMNVKPALGDIATGYFILTDNSLPRLLTAPERGVYLFEAEPYQGAPVYDWDRPYEQIFYCNVALEALEQLSESEMATTAWKNLKGNALFFRSSALFELVQAFCKPYSAATANTDYGVPIPLTANVNTRPGRGVLQESYERIIVDMQQAQSLLAAESPIKNRPTSIAAMAMLSKIYLAKADYPNAQKCAQMVLAKNDKLLDYNLFKGGSFNVFPETLPNNNDEMIFYTAKIAYGFFSNSLKLVDPKYLNSFETNDLRKQLNFNYTVAGAAYFTGYGGLATAEQYLINAECDIRLGEITKGVALLNALRYKRYKAGTYLPIIDLSESEAMKLLISERKKELTWRGVSWYDLKRFNLEGKYTETLERVYNGTTYTLPPGDKRYVFPIPDDEIRENNIPQN